MRNMCKEKYIYSEKIRNFLFIERSNQQMGISMLSGLVIFYHRKYLENEFIFLEIDNSSLCEHHKSNHWVTHISIERIWNQRCYFVLFIKSKYWSCITFSFVCFFFSKIVLLNLQDFYIFLSFSCIGDLWKSYDLHILNDYKELILFFS